MKNELLKSVGRGSLLASSALFLLSCNSNPYADGTYTTTQQPRVQVQKVFHLESPPKVEFTEGVSGSFAVTPHIYKGNAIVTVEGLPAGAQFDTKKLQVSWTPDYNAGNDPNDPSSHTRIYDVVFTMQSDQDNVRADSQHVTVIVHDSPRTFAIGGLKASTYLTEGTQFTDQATINVCFRRDPTFNHM